MKTLLFICLVFLISCKTSDPAPTTPVTTTITAKDFVGTWLQSANSVTNCPNASNNTVEQGCLACNTYSFTETVATFNIPPTPRVGTYTIKGDSILMPFLSGIGLDKRRFTLVSGKLTLTYGTVGLNAGCMNNNIYLKN